MLNIADGSSEQVTDKSLLILRNLGLLYALKEAEAEDRARPNSADAVVTLSLAYTKVTDQGLKELFGLTNLAALDLRHTQVTDAGVAQLRKALPKCRIDR